MPLPVSSSSAPARTPLVAAEVEAALDAAGWHGPAPRLVGTVVTTREELSATVGTDDAHLACVVAEATMAAALEGHDPVRAAPGSTLWISALVRHDAPTGSPARPGMLPLAAALAVADAVRAAAGLPAETMWPDAVGVPGAMCGGAAGVRHLARVRVDAGPDGGGSSVVSVALAVDVDPLSLPAGATSLLLDGGRTDRAALLAAVLVALDRLLDQWARHDEVLAADYRERCRTIGRLADVDGAAGWVSGIDADGGLLVTLDATRTVVPAGADALR